MLVATTGDQRAVGRQREQRVHRPGALLQILDGFEQRDDVDVEAGRLRTGRRPQQAGFLEQQRDFEQVGNAVGFGNDAVG